MRYLLYLSIAMLSVNLLFAEEQEVGIRRLDYDASTPLADRLRADDRVVVVNRVFDIVRGEPDEPDATMFIADAAASASVIAVVDVTSVQSILVNNGSWIHTRLSGSVREVLKAKGATVHRGESLSVQAHGGQVNIHGVIVRAEYAAFPMTGQFLVFRFGYEGAEEANAIVAPLLIQRGKIVSFVPEPLKSQLDRLTLAEVKRQIHAVVTQ